MDATVASGWIGGLAGLGGAIVGAGGALLGGWLQHRQQEETAERERRANQTRQAVQTTANELLQLQQTVFTFVGEPGAASNDDIRLMVRTAVRHSHNARFSSMLIPEAPDLRDRLHQVFDVLSFASSIRLDIPDREDELTLWYLAGAEEGIKALAASVRGEPVPQVSPTFERYLIALGAHHPRR